MSDVTKPVILDETGKEIAQAISRVADAVKGTGGIVYRHLELNNMLYVLLRSMSSSW